MSSQIPDVASRRTIDLITRSFKLLEKSEKGAVVAVYATHREAEEAVRALDTSGVEIRTLSIVGRGKGNGARAQEDLVDDDAEGDRTAVWGKNGAFWGGVCGAVLGFALFFVSGVGPLLAAGPLVGWIVGGLEGAAVVGGMSSLGVSLFSMGVPKPSIVDYEAQVKAGKFMVVGHGSSDEVSRSRGVLAATPHQGVREHSCCA